MFQQGDVFLASIDRGVLKVPVQKDPVQIPLHFRGILTNWLLNRAQYARLNLDRLAGVSYDGNDQRRWFDLADQSGNVLRLMFPVGELTEGEAAVLRALRDEVCKCGLVVDRETRTALGVRGDHP